MKIIISHDVDHLYATDHITRDLIFPKLIIRSFLHALSGKISFKTVGYRIISVFEKRLNRIDEVLSKDTKYGVPSVFFFGMQQGIGMSYKKEDTIPFIERVQKHGFDVGVHGIAYDELDGIKKEYQSMQIILNRTDFGIRTHYVRFNESTFSNMEQVGYLFDTSDFNKQQLEIKAPYKVGNMWEFPLHIMDGYIMPAGDFETGKRQTIEAIKKAEQMKMPYCTILYHDYQYNDKTYPAEKKWYDWLLDYIKDEHYELISYRDAIKELNENGY